jgi:hypothetical protein
MITQEQPFSVESNVFSTLFYECHGSSKVWNTSFYILLVVHLWQRQFKATNYTSGIVPNKSYLAV